jgi:hypothetical protein
MAPPAHKKAPAAPKKAPPLPPVISGSKVPALRNQENTPADVTLYLEVDLKIKGQDTLTAVYVPDRKKLRQDIDVLLYLTGHKYAFRKRSGSINIEEHLKLTRPNGGPKGGLTYYPLREKIATASKKQFVFVAPTLGDHSEGGDLFNKVSGAGDPLGFLQEVLNGLQAHLPLSQPPTLGNIVLAAHSGGGVGLRMLTKHSAIANKVKEAWCFDCLYNDQTDIKFWSDWAKDPGHKLFVHSTGQFTVRIDPKKPATPDNLKTEDGTFTESNTIKKNTAGLSNVDVEIKTRTLDHNSSPEAWIADLVDQSSTLK